MHLNVMFAENPKPAATQMVVDSYRCGYFCLPVSLSALAGPRLARLFATAFAHKKFFDRVEATCPCRILSQGVTMLRRKEDVSLSPISSG